MRKIVMLVIIAAFLLSGATYSIAGSTKDLSSPGAAEAVNLSNYILGPGDKLEIKVYRNDELNSTLQIDTTGRISYPLLGDLQAAGMTVYALRDNIAKGLSKFLKDPQVMVYLNSFQSSKVTILGGVTTPGVISIDRPMTILEVISRAGGLSSSADKPNVVVIRKQQGVSTVLNLNLKRALQGDDTQNIALVRDDIVYVPTDINKVYVMGEINTQGPVQFEPPFKILELLSKAGGFTANANKTDILLIRNENGESRVMPLDLQKALENGDFTQNLMLQNGDIVYVQKDHKRVIVLGEVKTPGYYNYTSNPPLTLLEAVIGRAGGLTNNANAKKLVVMRKGSMKIINFKEIVEKGVLEDNIVLQNGDIVYLPTTFIADVENVLGHINTIFSSLTTVASPVVLWPSVKSAIKGTDSSSTIVLPTSTNQ